MEPHKSVSMPEIIIVIHETESQSQTQWFLTTEFGYVSLECKLLYMFVHVWFWFWYGVRILANNPRRIVNPGSWYFIFIWEKFLVNGLDTIDKVQVQIWNQEQAKTTTTSVFFLFVLFLFIPVSRRRHEFLTSSLWAHCQPTIELRPKLELKLQGVYLSSSSKRVACVRN